MTKFIISSVLFLIVFKSLNAQIHLNKGNLATQCYCDPAKSLSIYLYSRNIKTIDPATFNGLSSLQVLYLDSNQISSIDPATFNGLNSLTFLNLHFNQISEIHQETFQGLFTLKTIYLFNNKLKMKKLKLHLEKNVTYISVEEKKKTNNLSKIINTVSICFLKIL